MHKLASLILATVLIAFVSGCTSGKTKTVTETATKTVNTTVTVPAPSSDESADDSTETTGQAKNLVASTDVKQKLRGAYIVGMNLADGEVSDPIKGTVYYASYQQWEYAMANFTIPEPKARTGAFRRSVDCSACKFVLVEGNVTKPSCIFPQAVVAVWKLSSNAQC